MAPIAAAVLLAVGVTGCARLGAGSALPSASVESLPGQSSTPYPTSSVIQEPSSTTAVCEDTIQEPQPAAPADLAEWHQATLQGYMDNYGVSFEEAVRRFIVSDRVETLLEGLVASHGALVDIYFLEHDPEFRAVIRVSAGTTSDEMCALVADWPMLVAVELGATTTYAELESGYRVLSDMFMSDELPFWEVALDTQSNSIVVRGPDRPSAGELAVLSDLAGVPVRFELMAEKDRARLLPELPTPSPAAVPY